MEFHRRGVRKVIRRLSNQRARGKIGVARKLCFTPQFLGDQREEPGLEPRHQPTLGSFVKQAAG